MGLFSFDSLAELDETTCFCKKPIDCEVGTVECAYKARFQNFSITGKLEGKFVSGDDPSPEVGKSTRTEIDSLKRFDIGFFATTCNTKNFNVEVTALVWTFLSPGDFKNVKRLTDLFRESFIAIPFDGTTFYRKVDSSDGQFSLEVTCAGKSP